MRLDTTGEHQGDRTAAGVFALGLAGAFSFILFFGVEQWFFLDEWDFLADRTAWNRGDMLRPHNEHWSTVPILIYRAMYRIFGLESYLPYRALAIAGHLAAAVVMRGLLRHIGLGPWLASAVVAPWVLFGSGRGDIIWGFQIAWSGVLICAVSQLRLADHDGSPDRRDLLALGVGLIGLMCAGIAVPLVLAVGLALLLRRGWRAALLQTVPLMTIYGLWSARYGEASQLEPVPDAEKADFVWTGLSEAVRAFSWVAPIAVLLSVAVLTATVAVLVGREDLAFRDRLPVAAGLAGGAVAFLYVVASGRAALVGSEFATSSRYLHVVTYLLLPLLGLAALVASALIRRLGPPVLQWAATGVGLAVLWFGIPGNIGEFSNERFSGSQEAVVEGVAAAVVEDPTLPAEANPLGLSTPHLTIGWLRQAVDEGNLSARLPTRIVAVAAVRQSLLLVQIDERVPGGARCGPLSDGFQVELQPQDRVVLRGGPVQARVTVAPGRAFDTRFVLDFGRVLQATAPLSVMLSAPDGDADLCR